MMTSSRTFAAALASMLAIAAAGAQDTTSVPNLTGTVQTVTGRPIEGVEVRVDGSSLATRTDTRGHFAFLKAPKGPQLLRFRLLGYLPTATETRVPTKDPDPVTMLALPRSLDTVRVVASVNILAGVVVDDKDKPIPGATVEMLSGTNNSATTDSSGWFTFTSVRDGTVLVRARKLGFAPDMVAERAQRLGRAVADRHQPVVGKDEADRRGGRLAVDHAAQHADRHIERAAPLVEAARRLNFIPFVLRRNIDPDAALDEPFFLVRRFLKVDPTGVVRDALHLRVDHLSVAARAVSAQHCA